MNAYTSCRSAVRQSEVSNINDKLLADTNKNNHIRFESEREVVSEDISFQVDFLMRPKKVSYLPETHYYYITIAKTKAPLQHNLSKKNTKASKNFVKVSLRRREIGMSIKKHKKKIEEQNDTYKRRT